MTFEEPQPVTTAGSVPCELREIRGNQSCSVNVSSGTSCSSAEGNAPSWAVKVAAAAGCHDLTRGGRRAPLTRFALQSTRVRLRVTVSTSRSAVHLPLSPASPGGSRSLTVDAVPDHHGQMAQQQHTAREELKYESFHRNTIPTTCQRGRSLRITRCAAVKWRTFLSYFVGVTAHPNPSRPTAAANGSSLV
jgi:hypothetical protein